jgi:hypothetical protein
MGRGEEFHREVRDRIEWVVKNLVTQFREAGRRDEPAQAPSRPASPWIVSA